MPQRSNRIAAGTALLRAPSDKWTQCFHFAMPLFHRFVATFVKYSSTIWQKSLNNDQLHWIFTEIVQEIIQISLQKSSHLPIQWNYRPSYKCEYLKMWINIPLKVLNSLKFLNACKIPTSHFQASIFIVSMNLLPKWKLRFYGRMWWCGRVNIRFFLLSCVMSLLSTLTRGCITLYAMQG